MLTKINIMEKIAKVLWKVIVGAVVLAFIVYGYFIPTKDEGTLYAALHPTTLWDILGTILFVIGASFIAGMLPVDDWVNDKRVMKGKKEIGMMYFIGGAILTTAIGWLLTIV